MTPRPQRFSDPFAGMRLPYAEWLSGLALAMLAVGTYGALQPLLPAQAEVCAAVDDTITITDFQPPAAAPAAPREEAAETPPGPEPEIEIPPLPEMISPLTPPEVAELTPEDRPPQAPLQAPKRTPQPQPRPQSRHPASTAPTSTTSSSAAGTGGAPTLFTGAGSGRFPQPTYPLGARNAHVQGSVRLLVMVEASGIPSSVEITSSSGSSLLDRAAADCISRRWRWPSGPVRRYIVPIRFQLR